MPAILNVVKATKKGGVPQATLELVHLRASQINGCSYCVDMHARDLKKAGETDERLFAVAAWREAPYFTGSRNGGANRRYDGGRGCHRRAVGAGPGHA
jgi:AhpD family alkylhydroperoxidase